MKQMNRINEHDTQVIIDALHGYSLSEQVACLMSMIFSHVMAACGHDMAQAEMVMAQVIQTFPRQWEMTKGLFELEQLPVPQRPN